MGTNRITTESIAAESILCPNLCWDQRLVNVHISKQVPQKRAQGRKVLVEKNKMKTVSNWVCLKIPCPTREVWLGGMIRGYDSGYDSWVWFVGMIRGPWFSVSLDPPRIVMYPHLPRKCFNCWQVYHTWSALELAGCWRCACCCQSGVCALERASWCHWNAAARCWWQGVVCCQNGVYSLERCWWRSGCCCRCCLRVMIEGAAVRVVYAVNPALERACWWADAGGRCCLSVLSS